MQPTAIQKSSKGSSLGSLFIKSKIIDFSQLLGTFPLQPTLVKVWFAHAQNLLDLEVVAFPFGSKSSTSVPEHHKKVD